MANSYGPGPGIRAVLESPCGRIAKPSALATTPRLTPATEYCTTLGRQSVPQIAPGDDRLSPHARPVQLVKTGGAGGPKRVGVFAG
jgi:hypothetical protein